MASVGETAMAEPAEAFIEVRSSEGRLLQSGMPEFAVGQDLPHAIGSVSWRWDGARVVANTCRYGVRPLFYASSADRILIAPSIATLLRLGASAALDEPAIAVFARFVSFVGEDTPFRGIKALPPGGTLSWNGNLSLTRREIEIEPRGLGRAEAIAEYAARFRRAMARCAGPASLVPLSGGRDSRHIAFEARRLGRLARCFTLAYRPPKSNEDMAVARRVTAALGTPHELLAQRGDRLAMERHTAFTCSFTTNEHFWLTPLDRRLAGATSIEAPLLDGIGGDVLSAGLFLDAERLTLFRQGKLTELSDRLLAAGGSHLPYMKDPASLSLPVARGRLLEELERHAKRPNPVASFFFWNRTRRCIAAAPFAMLAAHRVHCPYLDPEVFDFLLGLPPELFLDHGFHTDTIHAAFPEHAGLPFETKTRKRVRSIWHLRHYAARLTDGLLRRPVQLLDRRYCLERLGHMLVTGNHRFFWLAQAISYFGALEEVTDPGLGRAVARWPQIPPMLPPVTAVQPGRLL
jgi:asparagine synthase (glutamine-hydrolysing)